MLPLVPAGEIERYAPDNLWEKIDGEAEFYRLYGLEEVVARRFVDPGDDSHRLEVTIFKMREPLGAFGVFAAQRPEGGGELPLGLGGSIDDYKAFFWQGSLFILVEALGPEEELAEEMKRAMASVAEMLGAPEARPSVLKAFEVRVDPETIQYHPDHLLGREALPPGLEGRTAAGKTVFLATRPVEEGKLIREYGQILEESREIIEGPIKALSGNDPILGPVTLIIKEGRLAGLREPIQDGGFPRYLQDLLNISED